MKSCKFATLNNKNKARYEDKTIQLDDHFTDGIYVC
jgi:hypothetical protein